MCLVAALAMQFHIQTMLFAYLCVDIRLCVTWQAGAVIGGVSLLDAGASVLAWRGAAWRVGGLAVLASVLLRTAAVV